jgi:hypothetical protein
MQLAYHRVREMISAKILGYYWIDGKLNPADIASKHWSYPQVWHLLKPILFYSGNTNDLLVTEENSDENISKMVSDAERNNFSTDRPIKSNGMSK